MNGERLKNYRILSGGIEAGMIRRLSSLAKGLSESDEKLNSLDQTRTESFTDLTELLLTGSIAKLATNELGGKAYLCHESFQNFNNPVPQVFNSELAGEDRNWLVSRIVIEEARRRHPDDTPSIPAGSVIFSECGDLFSVGPACPELTYRAIYCDRPFINPETNIPFFFSIPVCIKDHI